MGKKVKEIDEKQRPLEDLIDDVKTKQKKLDREIAKQMSKGNYDSDATGTVLTATTQLDNALQTFSDELTKLMPNTPPQKYTGC